MFKKNDPLIDSVQKVMIEGNVRRTIEEIVNEAYGITSIKALPHELVQSYQTTLKESLDAALKDLAEGNLQEVSKERLRNYYRAGYKEDEKFVHKWNQDDGGRQRVGYRVSKAELEKQRKRSSSMDTAINKIVGKHVKVPATGEGGLRDLKDLGEGNLQEVSKEKVKKYLAKNQDSYAQYADIANAAKATGNKAIETMAKKKMQNRVSAGSNAMDKLHYTAKVNATTKEEVEALDEVSKERLSNYVKGAKKDYEKNMDAGTKAYDQARLLRKYAKDRGDIEASFKARDAGDKSMDKAEKRSSGIDKARAKLGVYEEEFETKKLNTGKVKTPSVPEPGKESVERSRMTKKVYKFSKKA